METIKQKYRSATGQEPGNISLMGSETSKKLFEVLSRVYGGNFLEDVSLREAIYYTTTKTIEGFKNLLIQGHKENGNYWAEEIDMDISQLPEDMRKAAFTLKTVGESITHYHEGHDAGEISKSVLQDVGNVSVSNNGIERVLKSQDITESELIRISSFEIKGNDREGYIANVQPRNQYGIHARPAALIAKVAQRYDCDVRIKKGDKTISAKSIMSVMTLESPKGTDLILETEGAPDAKACLENLVKLFSENFGETDD